MNKEIKDREWNLKVFATPKVPRGSEGMINTINIILQAVKDKVSPNANLDIHDTNANTNLNYLCIQLRPIGIVKQTYGIWELSEIGEKYLEKKEKEYLAKIFCANIKFFSEMIENLKTEKTSKELYDIAVNDYKINWKTKSDINARLTWLREFEFIDYNDYKMTYILNSKGIEFSKNINYTKPEEIKIGIDNTINDEKLNLTVFGECVLNNSDEKLKLRKESIGYIPGNIDDFTNTISEYVHLTENFMDVKNIYEFSKETYGISNSSAGSFISTLNAMEFIEHKSRYILKASNNALSWNEEKNELDLLCWINYKYMFVFEILFEIKDKSLSVKELVSIAKVYYGYKSANIDEIRKRIKMLLVNNLIMEDSLGTFTITNKGKLLLNKVSIQKRSENLVKSDINNEKISYSKNSLIEDKILEMRMASRDSVNPNRLEKILRDIWDILGFNSKWLGGSGKTDILLKTHTTPKFSYSVVVDAKSSASGNVTENLINFDTIKEHKKKHNANYAVIIGEKFQGERLIERAKQHNVLLLNIDDLEQIIRENQNIPLSFDSYRKLFEQNGTANIEILNEDRNQIKRIGILMQSIMDCLIDESDDEYTEGILTERDLYRSLRNEEKIQDISPNEIHTMLDFLSSPLIGCVGHTKDGYYAIESLENISKKLEFYSNSCKSII